MTQKANPVTLTLKIAAKPPPLPSEPFEPERRRRLSIRRLYDFRRQRRYKKWRPKGRHTFPAERCYIPPEGGALNPPVRRSRSQAEPWQPRAKGPAAGSTLTPVRACQPSGIQLPADSSRNPWFSLPRQRPLSHFPNFSSKASFSASSLVFPSFMKRRISFSMAS